MRQQQIIRFRDGFKEVFMGPALGTINSETGFVLRNRVVTAMRFLHSLLGSMGSRDIESIADLVRDFNRDHEVSINYKPYHDRLNRASFPMFLRAVFALMMRCLVVNALRPTKRSPLARFRDIVIQDGSSFALHPGLRDAFPGRFTKVSPAAVELHVTLSLYTDAPSSVQIAPDKECERHFLPDPSTLKGKLFLGDRGYDSTQYLWHVHEAGGSFIVRLRCNHDPFVFELRGLPRQLRCRMEGLPLSRVLRCLPKDRPVDLVVGFGEPSSPGFRHFRLVMVWNPIQKTWHRLLTNVDDFKVDDVLEAYRLRWQVELFFKELKSYANLHCFVTRKKHIAEGLFWASLCSAFLKRVVAYSCQGCMGVAISTRRVAMCGHSIADMFAALWASDHELTLTVTRIFEYLAHNARRSNPRRELKSGRLVLALFPVGVRR